MMQQYYDIKEQYQDSILFFRLGDFYEMFAEDAKIASKVLEIALTSRDAGEQGRIPMCGVPHHAAEGYLAKLIKNGFKVALCEQLEDPKEAKGVVRRDVVRVITPGTFMEANLESAENQYLVALTLQNQTWGVASLDMSTGEFMVTSLRNWTYTEDELLRLKPAEIIVASDFSQRSAVDALSLSLGSTITVLDQNSMSLTESTKILLDHFGATTLTSFGLTTEAEITAAGQALDYVQDTQKSMLNHIKNVSSYKLEQYLQIDGHSRQNLELTRTIRDGKKHGSLLGILDSTATSMGARLLRNFLEQPLLSLKLIEARHEAVDQLVNDTALRLELKDLLENVYDLERLVSKLVMGNGNARDLNFLGSSLANIIPIKKLFRSDSCSLLNELANSLNPLSEFVQLIEEAIVDEPAISIREGNLIRDGYHPELDQLRKASRGGKDWIRNLQTDERKRTGIKSLKVGFNKVFGYYIEVTHANSHLVPDNYQRRQTLTNAERYITPELKEQESLVLGADEKINDLEYELFIELRQKVRDYVEIIQQNARALATFDVLQSLASVAVKHNFVKPTLHSDSRLNIKQGRHPVIEAMEGQFVPNDVFFDSKQQIILLTGPNMAGKSTYLRQVALIVIMAQMGSFIPAEEGHIGLVDHIFTRIGASDDLSTGQSTFMVECAETAQLLLNASERSLIILDELGRGTSTFDGMAIAQAVIENIHSDVKARTLFSTHFHELTKLEHSLKRLVAYRVEVEEKQGEIYFLHTVSKGSTDRSYGINVARMAGIPSSVVKRSLELLNELETSNRSNIQLDLFHNAGYEDLFEEISLAEEIPESVLEQELLNLDLNSLTPLEALQKLVYWQNEVRQREDQ